MFPFHSKKINHRKSIGEILKKARERSGLSLSVLARQLNIKVDFLENIENDNLNALPGEFYIKIYVKKYAQALGVSWLSIKPLLEQEMEIYRKWHRSTHALRQQVSSSYFVVMPKIIKKTSLFLLVFVLLSYLGYQIWQITSPPKLEILNPIERNIILNNKTFVVSGVTETDARVTINSQEVFPDQTGFFSLQLDLSAGLNLIKIKASKRYSRAAVAEREVVVERD